METQECLAQLQVEKEKKLSCRFPCRVIFTRSRRVYKELLNALTVVCDRTVSADELLPEADIMPQYDTIIEKLKSDEWVLLPGVSEYLRLFHKSEMRSRRLGKLWHSIVDAENTCRVIIPLWNCEALWYDNALGLCTDIRQEDYVFKIDELLNAPEKLNVLVFSAAFEEYVSQLNGKFTLIVGLREWYERLSDTTEPLNDYCLLTKQVRSIEPTVGDTTIRLIKDAYAFVKESLGDGSKLDEAFCTDEMLDVLIPQAIQGVSLNTAILNCFNLVSFDGLTVMSGWNTMPNGKRQLLRLWYHLNPDDSYLCHVIASSDDRSLFNHALLDIFDAMQHHPEWICESKRLASVLGLTKSADFFTRLDEIPEYEDRLEFLTADTREERIYILRMVGVWMKKDAAQACACEKLRSLYPALFAYLQRMPERIESVYSDYIFDYKVYKLSNTLPVSDEEHFRGIEPDTLPSRYAVLQKSLTKDAVILWIDAMGFEYLSLLKWVLEGESCGSVTSVEIAQATLPTETKFNEQWQQMTCPYEKRDKLDKLAHKGVIDEPDYYSCIEEQLSFFDTLRKTVRELFKTYHRVIITGDHGTSRIAARYFHEREGFVTPKNTTVFSHGRYCRLGNDSQILLDAVLPAKDSAGNQYWVFKTYDHFKIGGFVTSADDDNIVYGELHGGASPEEMIVPVVVFDNNFELPLTAKWKKSSVSLKKKQVRAEINLSRAVSSLQVKIGSTMASCESEDGAVWQIAASGISPNQYAAHVVADGQIVDIDPLTIKSALGGDDF